MSKEEEVRKSNSFNRNNGRSKQELARKLLKVPDNKGGRIPADEEDWNSHVLFEVKSGKQVDPIATRFYNAESQNQEFRDSWNVRKPFSMIAMPNGTGDGLFICRLSELEEVVKGLRMNWLQKTADQKMEEQRKGEKDNGLD